MAEALANALGRGGIIAYSAGSQPTTVHPFAVKAMEEMGLDISKHYSKSFADVADRSFDYVITLCAEGELACPIFPGDYKRLYWPMPDPSSAKGSVEDKMAAFRRVREQIAASIADLADKETL
jgi:arsenate reductase